ncbi:MAG: DUF6298 domain-containing protein [Pirellulales bacterium]
MNEQGFRGAVYLPPGRYPVSGSLSIRQSGVVLSGSGIGPKDTVIIATGKDRRALIEISGKPLMSLSVQQDIVDQYVPLNANEINVSNSEQYSVGDSVRLTHPSTATWIASLGMDNMGGDRHGLKWRPGSRDLVWLRTVVKAQSGKLTLDAPLTYGLDRRLSQCKIERVDIAPIVCNSAVENLSIESEFDAKNPLDEEHAWIGVSIEHARDVWVRRVVCRHLTSSAVAVWENASRVTVEDCKNLSPVSELGGHRRRAFFTAGQQVLFQRLYSEEAVHDFCVGLSATGPNVFFQCESSRSIDDSGPIDSAACATLMDRVAIDGRALGLRNRGYQGQGVGWASFGGVLWNCSASVIVVEKPSDSQNWSFGSHGQFNGNGAWFNSDDNVSPDSLYYAQLAERIGHPAVKHRALLNLPKIQGSRAPTLEAAAEAIGRTWRPRLTMSQFIDQHCQANPLPRDVRAWKVWSNQESLSSIAKEQKSRTSPNFEVTNGWITIDGRLAIGTRQDVPWWNGGLQPDAIAKASPALTRFVPGRKGKGYTDDVSELVDSLQANGKVMLWQHPPLWYERRRDDHSRVQRLDGEVVGPFYETPWPRSGQGLAADGLSKWDLEQTNPWYFSRLRKFANSSADRGILLFNGLYMQHNILEAGAHYVDSPWRPANNVNQVGLAEPPFFAGDKLIYIAEQFYDLRDPDRAKLHRTYMRNVLDQLADLGNVILFLSEEYTGPESFVRFWLETVSVWSEETGKKPSIALYATKDVTDAVMNDPQLAKLVTLIYNRFGSEGWWYQPDGSLYAPQGGKNLAPRQWIRLLKPRNPGFEQVHQAVREYRTKYPDKPFVYQGSEQFAWANLLGGGSLVPLPSSTDAALLKAIVSMKPLVDRTGLADGSGNSLLFANSPPPVKQGKSIRLIDMKSGQLVTSIQQETDQSVLYWISD